MGPVYSWFYLLRPVFWTYLTYRLVRCTYVMAKNHWYGYDESSNMHYFWYHDTLYPDLLHDADDMRYINFRYTDAKVTPEPMTGWNPVETMRYNKFLKKKEPNAAVDLRKWHKEDN